MHKKKIELGQICIKLCMFQKYFLVKIIFLGRRKVFYSSIRLWTPCKIFRFLFLINSYKTNLILILCKVFSFKLYINTHILMPKHFKQIFLENDLVPLGKKEKASALWLNLCKWLQQKENHFISSKSLKHFHIPLGFPKNRYFHKAAVFCFRV